jgi:hypothetical protein
MWKVDTLKISALGVLGFEGEEFGYELQIGLPGFNEYALGTMFKLDPRI